MSVRIRPATAADHPTFVRLFPELEVDETPWGSARFSAEMVATTLIAEDGDDRAIGYAYFKLIGESAHVSQIVVAPDARRRGVGLAFFEAIASRALREGCKTWRLNVKRDNTAAISLYERVGMMPAFESVALRMDWSAVGTGDEGVITRLVEPSDDERVERAMSLLSQQLTAMRAVGGRVLLLAEGYGEVLGVAVFDPRFPGASPFRAARPEVALALLRALRPSARSEDTFLNVTLEAQPAIAQTLIAMGARVRFEMLHMSGPLPS